MGTPRREPENHTEHLTPDGTGVYEPPPDDQTIDVPATPSAVEPAGDGTGVYTPSEHTPPDDRVGTAADFTGEYVPGNANHDRTHDDNADNRGATGTFDPDMSVVAQSPRRPTPGPAPAATPEQRYLPRRFHARGGMGEIWLADDQGIGRSVALKKMLGGRPDQQARFLFEARVTGQLEHPGVVPVHEVGRDAEGKPFYVMKFVHGKTLKSAVEQYHGGPASDVPREVQAHRLLQIFLDLCQTVAYAHSKGVLHRDLKPENVMVGAYGETLVLDWGLAKILGSADNPADPDDDPTLAHASVTAASTETQAGSIMGSPYYMAPETAAGRNKEVDQRTDVYLLGATLYEILTGRTPRQGNNAMKLIGEARDKVPPAPRTIKREIPRPLEAICQKAMAFRQDDRYPTALALAEDVQRYLAGEPVAAYRESALERAWRWAKRHRKLLGRSAAALFVLGLVGFGAVQLREAERRQEEARKETAELRRLDEARLGAKAFRDLADEARFFAANSNPVAERAPFYDPDKAAAASRAALKKADEWGNGFEELPLEGERGALKEELYDLLLLTAQARSGRAPDAVAGQDMLALLERAAPLHEPTRGYHRLRATAAKLIGDGEAADRERKLADAPEAPTTALDHFLQAEHDRAEAATASAGEAWAERQGWQPGKDLINRAIGGYREAVRLDPTHYWSHYQLGRCYMSLGRGTEAAEALGVCVALRPDSPWGYSARGFALAQQGRYDEAEADLDHVLKMDPDLRPARLNRGCVYWHQKRYDEALKEFDAVLQPPQEKQLREAIYYRALVHLARGKYAEAMADFDRMGNQPGGLRPVYRLRAVVHFSQTEDDKGLEDLNAYLAQGRPFDPKSREAFERRGHELRLLIQELPQKARQSKRLLAASELKKAVEMGGESTALFDDYGAILDELGRVEEADEVYTRGLKLDPKNVKLLLKRGWARQQLKREDEARDDFAAALKIDPTHAEAHSGLGYVHACRKAAPEARREANLALLHGAGDYLILHNVACIYGKLSGSDRQRAKEYEDLALDLLGRAVALWKRGGTGPDETVLMRGEEAFLPALKARPEFQKLLTGEP